MKRTLLKPGSKPLARTVSLSRSTTLKTSKTLANKTGLTTASSLTRKTALTQHVSLTAATTISRSKKTLVPNPARLAEAKKYHNDVFRVYGSQCVLCVRPHPATQAAHVIKRSTLGRLRYADVRFARPAHDDCHREQEANRITFSPAIIASAIIAYNALTRNKKKLLPNG